jgi:hypothetical protein
MWRYAVGPCEIAIWDMLPAHVRLHSDDGGDVTDIAPTIAQHYAIHLPRVIGLMAISLFPVFSYLGINAHPSCLC